MKELKIYSSEYIMNTPMKPIEYCVDGLISQGLFILAGAPKVGKSWLALDVCLSIAKGEKVLAKATSCGHAVYLSLEDSLIRLQNRLYELTDEPSDNLHFAILAETINNGLAEQIEYCKKRFDDLKIVVIDTLQKVRNESDSSYGSDYKELSVLKSLADKLGIAIILVHHTRKCSDSDPFNMISDSTGLRLAEVGIIFRKLYEDHVLGTIDDDQFRMLSQGYADEQNQLKAEISDLNKAIQELKSQTADTAKFTALAKKYTDITELTQEILHTFVSRIEVHEKLKDDNGSVTQEIDIYFTHIGIVK